MSITAPVAAIVVALISAAISIVSLKQGRTNQVDLEEVRVQKTREIEEYKSQLTRDEADSRRDRDAQELVKHFRDPLLRTANDFQSRLYNILGSKHVSGQLA